MTTVSFTQFTLEIPMLSNEDFEWERKEAHRTARMLGVTILGIMAGMLAFAGWVIVKLMSHFGVI